MSITEILMSKVRNLRNEILTSAAENANGIDNDDNTLKGNEISIFLESAKSLVDDGSVSDDDFKKIFGFSASETDEERKAREKTEKETQQNSNKSQAESRGERLYKYLNGANFGWQWHGGGDHDKAYSLITKTMKGSTNLEYAYFIKAFNAKAKESEQDGICTFMMDEAWDDEEECVQTLTNKVIEMYDKLKKDGVKFDGNKEEMYKTLTAIKEDKDILEDYDDDEETMNTIDEFVTFVTDKYIEKYGLEEE